MKQTVVVALLLPLIALLGWVLQLEYHARAGHEVRIKIKGYDPRDLLSGHYIRYLLDLGEFNACEHASRVQAVCVCLNKSSDGKHYVADSSTNCRNSLPNCEQIIRGDCASSQFLAGVERYSIPESLAPVLATLPANSSVILALDREGNGQVKQILVDEEALEQYATRKLARQDSPAR